MLDPLEVGEPRTWLLRVGWEKHGAISAYAIPGSLTTSDMPLSGVNVTITIPPVAFVRVSPSV